MNILTGPLGLLGRYYLSYWYIIDFGVFVLILYAALENKNSKKFKDKIGINDNLTRILAGILAIVLIMTEWQIGKNLGDYLIYLIFIVALIFWKIIWDWLRKFSKDISKIGSERVVETGILSAVIVLAIFYSVLRSGAIKKYSFLNEFSIALGYNNFFSYFLVLVGAGTLIWIIYNLVVRKDPTFSSMRDANDMSDVGKDIIDNEKTEQGLRDELEKAFPESERSNKILEGRMESVVAEARKMNNDLTTVRSQINRLQNSTTNNTESIKVADDYIKKRLYPYLNENVRSSTNQIINYFTQDLGVPTPKIPLAPPPPSEP